MLQYLIARLIVNCCFLIVFSKCVFQLLLSGDDVLQVTSARCIAAVLVRSPSQYSPVFIKADLPGNNKHNGRDMILITSKYFHFLDLSPANHFLWFILRCVFFVHFCLFSAVYIYNIVHVYILTPLMFSVGMNWSHLFS